MFTFFSNHYEKIILASLLIVFAALLVWQINFLQAAQTRNVEEILNQVEPPTDQTECDFKQAKYSTNTIFSRNVLWRKPGKGINSNELFTAEKLALCPFCFNLIPVDSFPAEGQTGEFKCPIADCAKVLRVREARLERVISSGETEEINNNVNNNMLPDDWERKYDIFSETTNREEEDLDNDGFLNWEEYVLETNPKDPKDHKPYIDYITVKELRIVPFRALQYRGLSSAPSKHKEKLELNINHRENGRERMRPKKIGDEFKHDKHTFVILDAELIFDANGEPVDCKKIVICRKKDGKLLDERIECEKDAVVTDPVQTLVIWDAVRKTDIRRPLGGEFTLGTEATGMATYRIESADGNKKTAVLLDADGNKVLLKKFNDEPVAKPPRTQKEEEAVVEEDPGFGGLEKLDYRKKPAKTKSGKRSKSK